MSDQAAPAQDLVPVLGHVDDYLRFCMQYDASDLHLATASQPIWRRYGNLMPIWNNSAPLTPEDTRRLAYSFLTETQIQQLETKGDVDFAYMLNGVMQTGKNVGMITMDDSLRGLYSKGLISREECESRAEDKQLMRAFFQS